MKNIMLKVTLNKPLINSRTPFHSDVFGSFSWSSNIYGRKRWLILKPQEELKLKDSLGNLPFSISVDLLQENNVKYFDLVQNRDETLFVPSKWYHQVFNIEDSVSVNHNWFNGCNIKSISESLLEHFDSVEKEISDYKDMENYLEHCQLILKSSFGMNFQEFYEIISYIADKRIQSLVNNFNIISFNAYLFGNNHISFDLNTIADLCRNLKDNAVIKKYYTLHDHIIKLEEKIKIIL